jgi:hypothetical protein
VPAALAGILRAVVVWRPRRLSQGWALYWRSSSSHDSMRKVSSIRPSSAASSVTRTRSQSPLARRVIGTWIFKKSRSAVSRNSIIASCRGETLLPTKLRQPPAGTAALRRRCLANLSSPARSPSGSGNQVGHFCCTSLLELMNKLLLLAVGVGDPLVLAQMLNPGVQFKRFQKTACLR